MSVLCLACGGEAVARDRRVLHSATASNVVAAWKEIVELKAQELRVSVSKQVLAVVGTEESDKPWCMCRKCFLLFDRYLRLRESLLNNIHAVVTGGSSVIPCTSINIESTSDLRPITEDEPSRKRPADDDIAVPAKRCRLGESVPLPQTNPTAGKDPECAVQPCRQLNFAPPEPGRSPAVAVSL